MADIEEDLAPGKDTELEQEVTEFDWSDTGSVILPEQPETAIYHNERGDLVIRQRARGEDVEVIIAAELVDLFIDRLTDALSYASCP